jgi:DNA repair exonuclease SbcCD nuclease subunit
MTLSILCIGDPHFTASNARETDALRTETLRVITEESVQYVVILGDTLDRHETVNLNVLHRVKEYLFEILNVAKLYVLIGNHDIPNNKLFMSEVHPFMGWTHPNLKVIDRAQIVTIEEYKFLMVPYVPPGRFEEAIHDLIEDKPTCVFAHQEFKGCTYSGITSSVGDHYQHDIDVISGHIHERQRLARIYYPGTPYQTNMGETPNKGVSIFSWDEPNQSYLEKYISLNVPKKISLDMNAAQIRIWDVPDSINRYRIILHGSNAEFVALSKQGIIKNLTTKGVKVTFKDNEKASQPVVQREKLSFIQGVNKAISEFDPSIAPYLIDLSKHLFGA